jgi:hypothetical protein
LRRVSHDGGSIIRTPVTLVAFLDGVGVRCRLHLGRRLSQPLWTALHDVGTGSFSAALRPGADSPGDVLIGPCIAAVAAAVGGFDPALTFRGLGLPDPQSASRASTIFPW